METQVVTLAADAKKLEQKENLKTLQRAQQKAANGDKKAIKETDANRAKGVKIRDHEKELVHVEVTSRTLDEANQRYLEDKRVIKIQPRIFDQMIKDGGFAEYAEAKVIHDPRPNAPKEYNLRPAIPTPALPNTAADAALAAREQRLKDQEKRIAEAEARLEERLAKLEGADKQGKKGADLPPPPQV